MATKAYKAVSAKRTPQSEAIPGKLMVVNSAGGFSFDVDDWKRLDRFLILGSEGGTYYIGEQKLTKDNAAGVARCIATDGVRTVNRVVEISDAGRAPKNDPALFVLAMCAGLGDHVTRKLALDALPKVARTGTHLFTFVEYVQQFRGWGRSLRNAVGNWYNAKTPQDLAYQVVKYQQREGWSNADLLRKAHPIPASEEHRAIYKWVVDGFMGEPYVDVPFIGAFEAIKKVDSVRDAVQIITDYRLPREAIPTNWLSEADVWSALLENMPMTAMIRNLATMTRVGVIAPMSAGTKKVVAELFNAERIRKSRVHPLAVLVALKTYEQGHSERGSNTWIPVAKVVDALDGAFYTSFGNVEPTGKDFMLALDVSGSMEGGAIAGMPGITPRIGSAAMSLVTSAVEENTVTTIFSSAGTNFSGTKSGRGLWGNENGISTIDISKRQRLDDVIRKLSRLPFGGTDCSLPMIYALQNKMPIDTFCVYTDNETWAGDIHPVQALQEYRQKMGIPAKLVVIGMTATEFSIADQNDAGMLDVVGFDTATPSLISDFAKE